MPLADVDDLGATVERAIAEHDFSGVIRIDRGDAVAISVAAGLADRRHAVANTPTTRFGVASATKGFTALTIMSMAAAGALELDAPIRPVLGTDLPLIDDTVTFRQLLAHRSGIGDYLDEGADGDINDYVMPVPVHELSMAEEYLSALDGYPQREPPGSVFRYNNSGYVVLAVLAERVACRSYHALVDDLVVRPAGLIATAFDRGDELPGDVAVGYLAPRGLRSNVLHLPVRGVGDGGIVTTADDVHRLWAALFDDRVVPAATRREMVEAISDPGDGRERYGLGFWLHPTGRGVILEGMDAGVSFRSLHDPIMAHTYTVISNTSSGAWPIARTVDSALGLR